MAGGVRSETDIDSLRDRVLVHPRELSLFKQIGLVGLVAMALIPMVSEALWLPGFMSIMFFMMYAASWDFVSGYTGQISFGHTAFITAGAYTSAILNVDYGISPLVGIVLGVLMAGVLGLVVGLPALRLQGPYLALVTLIVPVIMLRLFIIFSGTLRGGDGFTVPPDQIISGAGSGATVEIGNFALVQIANYYMVFFVFLVVMAVLYVITRADAGDVFTAIREDEDAVAAIGLNAAKFKLFAFIVSAMAAGLAGGLFIHSPSAVPRPDGVLALDIMLDIAVMSVIGGLGTIIGPAVGAAFYILVNATFNLIPFTIPILNKDFGNLEPLPLYVIGVLVLFYVPEGIYGYVYNKAAEIEGKAEKTGRSPSGQAMEDIREQLEDLI